MEIVLFVVSIVGIGGLYWLAKMAEKNRREEVVYGT